MIIPILGWIIGIVGYFSVLVCWVIAIINAFQGKQWKVPFIGNLAAKQAGIAA
jgi:uncharacterized membrane protein